MTLKKARKLTDPDKIREVVRMANADVKMHIAFDKYTPDDVLKQLAYDADGEVAGWAMSNPRLDIKTLYSLLEDSLAAQYFMVKREDATNEMLQKLLKLTESEKIIDDILKHPNFTE